MPDGFWFVSLVVGGIIAASEWSRRLVERGMRSQTNELDEMRAARRAARETRAKWTGSGGAVPGPAQPRNEPTAIPQWQRDA